VNTGKNPPETNNALAKQNKISGRMFNELSEEERKQLPKALMAEFAGTFFFIFLGVGSVLIDQQLEKKMSYIGLVGIAFAFFAGLSIAITFSAKASGGHINPAVTLSLWLAKQIQLVPAVLYIIVQLLGAIVGAWILTLLFPPFVWQPVHLATPILSDVSVLGGILIEGLITFLLVLTVFTTAIDEKAPKMGGFWIGFVVLVGVLSFGPKTGAAFNPARWFGPALVSGTWDYWYVYPIAEVIGAVVAYFFYRWVYSSST
jgi:MIP family channel proteins